MYDVKHFCLCCGSQTKELKQFDDGYYCIGCLGNAGITYCEICGEMSAERLCEKHKQTHFISSISQRIFPKETMRKLDAEDFFYDESESGLLKVCPVCGKVHYKNPVESDSANLLCSHCIKDGYKQCSKCKKYYTGEFCVDCNRDKPLYRFAYNTGVTITNDTILLPTLSTVSPRVKELIEDYHYSIYSKEIKNVEYQESFLVKNTFDGISGMNVLLEVPMLTQEETDKVSKILLAENYFIDEKTKEIFSQTTSIFNGSINLKNKTIVPKNILSEADVKDFGDIINYSNTVFPKLKLLIGNTDDIREKTHYFNQGWDKKGEYISGFSSCQTSGFSFGKGGKSSDGFKSYCQGYTNIFTDDSTLSVLVLDQTNKVIGRSICPMFIVNGKLIPLVSRFYAVGSIGNLSNRMMFCIAKAFKQLFGSALLSSAENKRHDCFLSLLESSGHHYTKEFTLSPLYTAVISPATMHPLKASYYQDYYYDILLAKKPEDKTDYLKTVYMIKRIGNKGQLYYI